MASTRSELLSTMDEEDVRRIRAHTEPVPARGERTAPGGPGLPSRRPALHMVPRAPAQA
ncbi:hypothetical protein [Kocuria varians]|uniref:hypothetical protein n=1 Tax=Kocuria varians TaxID=1272 RepID=UPI0015F25C2A|nr:hypothetical protein [Kocuria varians]